MYVYFLQLIHEYFRGAGFLNAPLVAHLVE